MFCLHLLLMVLGNDPVVQPAGEIPFAEEVQKGRVKREESLRAENGWLSLVGRFPLMEGNNSIGTGQENDVVFPASLAGVGPAQLGSLVVDSRANQVTLRLADGITMISLRDQQAFTGDRVMRTTTTPRDWVKLGRMAMHVIQRNGKSILRLADNECENRTKFPGCIWYPPDETYRVEARFVPYAEGKTFPIQNIINEVSEQPVAGYAEFRLNGELHKLDALKEGNGLFFIFRDATAGDTTYGPGRFIDIEEGPAEDESFILDFNKAYNPPCAFSEFTTCPLPPRQNILKIRIEAGEKYLKPQS